MLVEDIRLVPVAIMRFSQEEIQTLAKAAARQIDGVSKAMLYEGGLIFNLARGHRAATTLLTVMELNALLNVTKQTHCMMADYDVQVLHDELANIIRRTELVH